MTTTIDNRQLGTVERWTLALAGVAIALAWALASRRFSLGVTVGAVIMILNAVALRRIGARVLATAANKPGIAILWFNVKMILLIGVVYVCVRYLPIDPIGFLVGISVFPVGVVVAALQMQRDDSQQSDTDGTSPPAPNGEH